MKKMSFIILIIAVLFLIATWGASFFNVPKAILLTFAILALLLSLISALLFFIKKI